MRQDQELGDGATGIQSAGDTVINGLSPEQMKQIIETIASQIPTYAVIAREVVDARLIDFERRVMDKFESDQKANAGAFKDPDFQYLVRNAQHAYARSGEEDVGEMLADLIAERSKSQTRDRLALTLNQAVEVSSNLTINEFAALAFAYLIRRTNTGGLTNVPMMANVLNQRIDPFIDDLTTHESSFAYLEAQRCATVSLGSMEMRDILVGEYPAFFIKGASADQYTSISPETLARRELFIPALLNPTLLQPNATSKTHWDDVSRKFGIPDHDSEQAWIVAQNTAMSREEIISSYRDKVPRIADAFEVWDSSQFKSLNLTTVGIAIGHAYAKKSGFAADLRIWIQ